MSEQPSERPEQSADAGPAPQGPSRRTAASGSAPSSGAWWSSPWP